jgi:hypothetical protein
MQMQLLLPSDSQGLLLLPGGAGCMETVCSDKLQMVKTFEQHLSFRLTALKVLFRFVCVFSDFSSS